MSSEIGAQNTIFAFYSLRIFSRHLNGVKLQFELIIEQICSNNNGTNLQRWSRGYKARGRGQDQGHKKIRGQGQPFRGQTLPRPRTGMLEAKAKDQGLKRKCSPN